MLSLVLPERSKLTVLGVVAYILIRLMYLFIILSVFALCFRWLDTFFIEVQQWFMRDVLNNIAGLYPGTH